MNDWVVIYCLLHNEDKIGHIISILEVDYFSKEITRKIFLYVRELIQKGLKPDLQLILSKFPEEKTEIEEAIYSSKTESNNYEEYVSLLRGDYVKNKIQEFNRSLSNGEVTEKAFIDKTSDIISSISSMKKENLHFAREIFEKVVERANAEEEYTSPIKYGVEPLDTHTGGLFAGEYVIVAGRPSMGKSGLMVHIALTNALADKVTIFFSLEMGEDKLGERFICNACDLELWKIKTLKRRSEEEQRHFLNTASILKEKPLIVETSASIDINNMRSVIQKVKLKYGRIDLVVVDYLQLMEGDGASDNSRVSAISRGLKGIASQNKIPIVVGSQLSRAVEQREDKRPILSDLRDSGSIEQDADMIFMLYRDSYYSTNPDHERILEILLRKYRNGEVKKFIIDYNMKKQTMNPINWSSRLGKAAKKFEYL